MFWPSSQSSASAWSTVSPQYGPRCGDGVKQSEHEQCDDGNSVGGDGCSAKCENEVPK